MPFGWLRAYLSSKPKKLDSVDIGKRITRFKKTALAKATIPSLISEIPALYTALDTARINRNKAQHGPWLGIDPTSGAAAKIDYRKNPWEWRDHTPQTISADARQSFQAALALSMWVSRYTTEVLAPLNMGQRP
jgi:hypothetical protein